VDKQLIELDSFGKLFKLSKQYGCLLILIFIDFDDNRTYTTLTTCDLNDFNVDGKVIFKLKTVL
jgi:hypothetical protein